MKTGLTNAGIVSYQSTSPSGDAWSDYTFLEFSAADGVREDSGSSTAKAMMGFLGAEDDYLQFVISNDGENEETYTLSFMFRFAEIAVDTYNYSPESVSYELPVKLVSLEGDNDENETLLKQISIPYACNTNSILYNREFYEISSTVNVPAGEKIRLQLKLDGELPLCQVPDSHADAENEPHPVVYTVDNIAISSGSPTVISMKTGETYRLQLYNTLETDTVEYYTNSYLAQYTHNDTETTCPRFDTITANVDGTGLITASAPGETALIAVITHQDGTVERKQCIVQVTE